MIKHFNIKSKTKQILYFPEKLMQAPIDKNQQSREIFIQYLQNNPSPPSWETNPTASLKEFWRQVIDGSQQADALMFMSLVYQQTQINLLNHLDMSIREVMQHHDGDLSLLFLIKNYCSQEEMNLTVRELFTKHNGMMSFEKVEKNYLKPMVEARNLTMQGELTFEKLEQFILQVHATAIQGVQFSETFEAGYKKADNEFGLVLGRNTSEEGLDEWISMLKNQAIKTKTVENDDNSIHFVKNDYIVHFINDNDKYVFYYDICENGFRCHTPPGPGRPKPTPLYTQEEVKEKILAFLKTGIILQRNNATIDLYKKEITQYLDCLSGAHEDASTDSDILYNKVYATVRFVKNALMLHPFPDANCRVLAMTILPALLSRLGLGNIYFFKDPNRFCTYSTRECVDEVITALIYAQQITSGVSCKLLEDSSTDRMCTFMTTEEKTYFFDCLKNYAFESHTPGFFASPIAEALPKIIKELDSFRLDDFAQKMVASELLTKNEYPVS